MQVMKFKNTAEEIYQCLNDKILEKLCRDFTRIFNKIRKKI